MSRGSPDPIGPDRLVVATPVRAGSAEPMLRGPLGPALAVLDVKLRRLPPLVALAAILGPFALTVTGILALGAYAVVTR